MTLRVGSRVRRKDHAWKMIGVIVDDPIGPDDTVLVEWDTVILEPGDDADHAWRYTGPTTTAVDLRDLEEHA
jgi:hypothetical protein